MITQALKRPCLVAAIALISICFSLSAYARVVAYTKATENFPNMLDDMSACSKAYQEYLYVQKKLNGQLTEELHEKGKRVCDKCQNKWPGKVNSYGRDPCK